MTGRTHLYRLETRWTGNRGTGTSSYRAYGRDHVVTAPGKPTIIGSADPAFRGARERWNPEELLVASLSACHMLWYLHLCAEAGIRVTAYEDQPEGLMVEEADGGGRFLRTTLRPRVTLEDGDAHEAERLHTAAHRLCFIARSVDFPVECEPSVVHEPAGATPAGDMALVLIDVQQGFDLQEQAGARRNNAEADAQIAMLLEGFRRRRAPVFHIRHHSREPGSVFAPSGRGILPKPVANEQAGEAVMVKSVNSAFIGTALEDRLRAAGIRRLVLCGATTNHCVETTARMAGNLGFETILAEDACWTYDRAGGTRAVDRAETIHAMTLANLEGEFARISSAAAALAGLAG